MDKLYEDGLVFDDEEDTDESDEDIEVYVQPETDGYIDEELFIDPDDYDDDILYDDKACALSNYLKTDIRTIEDSGYNEYDVDGDTYEIFDYDEAYERAEDYINDDISGASEYYWDNHSDDIINSIDSDYFEDEERDWFYNDGKELLNEDGSYANSINATLDYLLDEGIIELSDIEGLSIVDLETIDIGDDDDNLDNIEPRNFNLYESDWDEIKDDETIKLDWDDVDIDGLYDDYSDSYVDSCMDNYESSVDWFIEFGGEDSLRDEFIAERGDPGWFDKNQFIEDLLYDYGVEEYLGVDVLILDGDYYAVLQ